MRNVTPQIVRIISSPVICFAASLAFVGAEEVASSTDAHWPHWRGPGVDGIAPHGDPPVEWSETKNVKWKVDIPGQGHATPVVWGDRIFVLTAVETDNQGAPPAAEAQPNAEPKPKRRGPPSVKTDRLHQFVALALDRRTGKTLWQKTLAEERPHEGRIHADSTCASSSPVTDGKRVYAFFGSRGLYCLNLDGSLQWQKSFGKMSTRRQFGEGSSPTLHGDRIVINWDHEGQSFITVLDKRTGEEVWKVNRNERTSWSTPAIVEVNGKPQIISSATTRVRGYDLETGKVVWECAGMTENVIPTPLYADGIVYVVSGFRGNAVLAIRLSGAKGDITDSAAVVWKYSQHAAYTPSPLLLGGCFYMLRRNDGYLSCLDAATGAEHYVAQKLDGIGTVYASLTGARDRFYVVGKNGTTKVIQQGPELKIISTNVLQDNFSASPVIVGKELYLRGLKHLYCLAGP